MNGVATPEPKNRRVAPRAAAVRYLRPGVRFEDGPDFPPTAPGRCCGAQMLRMGKEMMGHRRGTASDQLGRPDGDDFTGSRFDWDSGLTRRVTSRARRSRAGFCAATVWISGATTRWPLRRRLASPGSRRVSPRTRPGRSGAARGKRYLSALRRQARPVRRTDARANEHGYSDPGSSPAPNPR